MSRREHIEQLYAAAGIPIYLLPLPWDGNAFYVPRGGGAFLYGTWFDGPCGVVFGWNPRRQYDYLSALHELGHHHTGAKHRTFETSDDTILKEEVDAWKWAFEHSMEKPNENTLRLVFEDEYTGLRSYLKGQARYASPARRATVTKLRKKVDGRV